MRRQRPGAGPLRSLWRLARFRLVIPVMRSPHPPEHTARGVAIGVFWGLTPTLGVQTLAIVLTWFVCSRLLRRETSLLQSLLWAWVNNPLTMLPLFYAWYLTGLAMMGDMSAAQGYDAFVALFDASGEGASFLDRTVAAAYALGWPTLLGSLPWAGIGSVIGYRWSLALLRRRRAALAIRRSEAVYDTLGT